jgi:Zn finger protein HypA/HybF involved in hydrogenase expression
MHEAGIADRILDIVIARATEAGAPRITAIHVEAGALSAVSEDSLRFHWEQHAAGTPAEGAVLHFTEVDEPTDLRLVSIDVEGAADADGDDTADDTVARAAEGDHAED